MRTTQATLTSWRKVTAQQQRSQTDRIEENPYPTDGHEHGLPVLVQQSISTQARTNTNKGWGHKFHKKLEGHFRIGLCNINSLPIYKKHSKNDLLIQDIEDGEFDVFCLTEINVAWHNIINDDRIAERFRGKLEFAKYITSHNTDKDYKTKQQSGGTMTICTGNICARTYDSST
jgi:hypothetical protein